MKLMIAAALAVIAVPAIAQDTPPPAPDQQAPATAPATPDPVGGYQPANPPAPPPPGATVQFQPSVAPDVAFPPPPPLAKYPPCKKGQHDKCMERGSPK